LECVQGTADKARRIAANIGSSANRHCARAVLVTERALTKYDRRIAQIDRQLVSVEKDMAVLIRHCRASDDEFQEAVRRHKREYCEAFELVLGTAIAHKQAKAALRRKA
jgi:hypothetical protein